MLRLLLLALPLVGFAFTHAYAKDIVTQQTVSLELARDLAQAAIDSCRASGFQVSAVVVNRAGDAQVVLRDSGASRYTMQIAQQKAEAVILSGVASSEFRKNRADIRPEMNHVKGILMLEGGVPIRSAGTLLGALGMSGAPGGDKDEACAIQAVQKHADRLEFAN